MSPRRRRRPMLAALALTASLALAGCAGKAGRAPAAAPAAGPQQPSGAAQTTGPRQTSGATVGSDPSKIDPCKLVTVAEVEATLHFHVTQTNHADFGSYNGCTFWKSEGGTGAANPAAVVVAVWPDEFSARDFEVMRQDKARDGKVTPLAGLGDAAFYVQAFDTGWLYVHRGNTELLLNDQLKGMFNHPTVPLTPGLRQLAALAASRL